MSQARPHTVTVCIGLPDRVPLEDAVQALTVAEHLEELPAHGLQATVGVIATNHFLAMRRGVQLVEALLAADGTPQVSIR